MNLKKKKRLDQLMEVMEISSFSVDSNVTASVEKLASFLVQVAVHCKNKLLK